MLKFLALKLLKKLFYEAKQKFQREHGTPYIYLNPKKYRI
jgi:spore coat polysaccharide biosynthesis protein SpsF (cytidylyltransferase family)